MTFYSGPPDRDWIAQLDARVAQVVPNTYLAAENLSALRAVSRASEQHLGYARPGQTTGLAPIGITTKAALAGTPVQIVISGDMQDDSWSWAVGSPILLGASGALTQTQPTGQNTMVVLGLAIAADTIVVRISQPIYLVG